MSAPIYLDYNATTPCDSLVIKEMLPYFNENFGNPDSRTHRYGWLAGDVLENARERLAQSLAVQAKNLFFNSGSTEAINTALRGLAERETKRNHIITCETEHKATLAVCEYLAQSGCEITYLQVDEQGMIDLDDLAKAIKNKTFAIALMYANNETGVIHPIKEIGRLAQKHGVTFMTDATQALSKISLGNFDELGVDIACFSAHKVYGPKGVGAMYLKDGHKKNALPALIHGGGQETGFRSGTVNLPGIVGFVKAVEISLAENFFPHENLRLTNLRDHLENELLQVEQTVGNGVHALRLPNVTNISFRYLDGEAFLRALSKDLAVSNGSACNSLGIKSSYVLQSMGVEKNLAAASLRLSLGRYTTAADIETAITVIDNTARQLRENNILWERRQSV